MGNPFWRTCATGLKPRDMAWGWRATWSVDIYAVVRPSTCCPSLLHSWMQASDMSQRMARTSRFLPVGILALERRLTVDCRRHLAAIPRTATLPRAMHWWSSSIGRCPFNRTSSPIPHSLPCWCSGSGEVQPWHQCSSQGPIRSIRSHSNVLHYCVHQQSPATSGFLMASTGSRAAEVGSGSWKPKNLYPI